MSYLTMLSSKGTTDAVEDGGLLGGSAEVVPSGLESVESTLESAMSSDDVSFGWLISCRFLVASESMSLWEARS